MKKETKVISILASAIFIISLLIMFFPKNTTYSYEDRSSEFSDFYWNNNATMYGFGSSATSINFEYLEGEDEIDENMFNFLKDVYNKFNYLDLLGSVSESGQSLNNIYDINNTELNTRVEINLELYTILQDSKSLFDISNGIFDITAGMLFDEIDNYVKEESDTYDVAQYVTGFDQNFDDRLLLEVVDSKYYATRTHVQTKLNLGGYLKGYFTEYVRSTAVDYFNNEREIFVNSASSSMSYIGQEVKNITLGSPREERECSVFTSLDECPGRWVNQKNYHLASSGDYVQYRINDTGARIHHLVDPRDGGFQQYRGMVSIMTNDYASYLDALSSIIFIANPSEYESILDQFDATIDVVYLTTNINQDNFDVDYIQRGNDIKFDITDIYLPKEVV